MILIPLIFPQTWPAPHPASDDDQPEQQRHGQDPPLRQDLPSRPVDPDQHRLHSLCALRVLSHTCSPKVLEQGEVMSNSTLVLD